MHAREVTVEIQCVDADGKRVEELMLGEVGGQHGPTEWKREVSPEDETAGAGPSRQHPAVVSIVEARDAPERCLIYFFFAFTPRPAALRAGAFLLGAFLLAPFFAPFDAVLLFAT